ncbi:MAG: Fis family transcriptional regulator [Verrucomicrobiales bacterium]|nr:Fis family transcriptional regulator [Verrucomicrobiales bacterium]
MIIPPNFLTPYVHFPLKTTTDRCVSTKNRYSSLVSVDLELLQRISLAVSQARTVQTVLPMIVSGLVETAHFGLARIWLTEAGPKSQGRWLQLAASAGRSQVDGTEWTRLDGEFSRIAFGPRKIGHIAQQAESLRLDEREVAHSHWTVHPDWIVREGFKGFAGHPLLFRGDVLGVLAIFSREPVSTQQFQWLRLFADQAAVAIANARAFEEIDQLRQKLEQENEYLKSEVKENFGGFVGKSPALGKLLQQIELVAPMDTSVLVFGESGTGKELVARGIHEKSKRRQRTLVKVNCASIPQELFESEFFGHVKGAFTGAMRDRAGRFQLADGGTLLLDEIGEIPLALQGKLLRVLQEGEFERVGDERTHRVDVRIIAATNRNLVEEIAAGRFRQDLYYRLSVFPLEVPPLRARVEDIPLLATYFLEQISKRDRSPLPRLTEGNVKQLMEYSWPGNIRELQNVLERAVILARGGALQFELEEGAAAGEKPGVASMTKQQWLESQRAEIVAALELTGGRIYGTGGAAERLRVRPTTLASRMDALGIKKK